MHLTFCFQFINLFLLEYRDNDNDTLVSCIVTYNILLFHMAKPITLFYKHCQYYKTIYYL